MSNVKVVIGAGSIGQAIARRVSAGKHVLLADLRQEIADAAAKRAARPQHDSRAREKAACTSSVTSCSRNNSTLCSSKAARIER